MEWAAGPTSVGSAWACVCLSQGLRPPHGIKTSWHRRWGRRGGEPEASVSPHHQCGAGFFIKAHEPGQLPAAAEARSRREPAWHTPATRRAAVGNLLVPSSTSSSAVAGLEHPSHMQAAGPAGRAGFQWAMGPGTPYLGGQHCAQWAVWGRCLLPAPCCSSVLRAERPRVSRLVAEAALPGLLHRGPWCGI